MTTKKTPLPSPFVIPVDLADKKITLEEAKELVINRNTITALKDEMDESPHKEAYDAFRELLALQGQIDALREVERALLACVARSK